MKNNVNSLILVAILAVTPAFAGETASPSVSADKAVVASTTSVTEEKNAVASTTANAAEKTSFTVNLKGTEVIIDLQSKQADLEASLTKLLGDKIAMEEKNRLQYDYQISEETGPMTVLIDWNKDGKIEQVRLDAMAEEQNPAAKELVAWLTKNAGPGKTEKNEEEDVVTSTWEHNGWSFTLTNGGSGEDSSYSFEINPLGTKKE